MNKKYLWAANILMITLLVLQLFSLTAFSTLLVAPTQGDSMHPTIENGELAVLIPDDFANNIDEKDIVLYHGEYPGSESEDYILHRVIDKEGNQYVTQGDGNYVRDPHPKTEEDIIATAVEINGSPLTIPYLGYLFFHPIITIVLLLATIVLYLVYK